jgi:large repetitive protein
VVYIGDLVPLPDGRLDLEFSTTANAGYGFNGGVIIMEYSDAAGGVITNSELDTAGTTAAVPPDYNVNVYPNPFLDVINVDFYNRSSADKISAEVYDLTGRLVYRKHFNTMPAGYNTLRLTGIESSKATSLCMVALKVNGEIVQTFKLMRMVQK